MGAAGEGVLVGDFGDARWRKSSYSAIGNCVEVSRSGGLVRLRDTKDREGTIVVVSAVTFSGFLASLKAGEFDPS